jgi:hypothetical protein
LNDRGGGIGVHLGLGRLFEERLERRSDRGRDNSVAESHVDLDVHLAWSERRSYLHFDSVVPIGVAIRDRRSHVIGVEDDSIIDVDTDDLAKARSDSLRSRAWFATS